jgi:uncharacterized protein YdeI (BOF family)
MAKKVAVKKVEEVVEVKKENAGGKRFSSWKARMIFNDGKGLSINVPIRYKKLDTKEIDEQNIINRSREGAEAKFKFLTDDGRIILSQEDVARGWFQNTSDNTKYTVQTKKWVTNEGEVVLDGVLSYQVQDGKETLVEKLKKSEELLVLATKPMAEYSEWLAESTYAIWGETDTDVYALSKMAKHLQTKDEFAVVKISLSSNSFKEYYGLIIPVMRGGQFGITMKISRLKIDFAEFGMMNYLDKQPVVDTEPANKAKSKMDKLV